MDDTGGLGDLDAGTALVAAVGALTPGDFDASWLRRLPPRRLLAADSWVRSLLLGCVPVAWATGTLHPVLYVVLLAGSSVLHAWGSAGKYALLARMLPPEQRLAANALASSTSSASVVIGPALAGFLATVVSPAWIIGLDAVSFAILAAQVGRLGSMAEETATAEPIGTGRSAAGLHMVRRQPELLGILALTWFFNFLYGPVEVALPLHVTDDLHSGASLLGLYWTLFGVGAVLGALTVGTLRRLPLWPVTLGIVVGWGLALVPFGPGVPTSVSVSCFALGGLIYGPFTALSLTLFQGRTPAPWLTTVLTARSAALLTAAPTGTTLGGPLATAIGPRQVLAASGVATITLALVAAAIRARGKSRALARPVARATREAGSRPGG
ncbi:MFS transporter [Kitasatospora sp. NPDC059648]|uniref:MFS transporter n=1 Tax=Kitasatospora sp. NPDC059648 TaxID=3346894 RepID=UPI0036CB3625